MKCFNISFIIYLTHLLFYNLACTKTGVFLKKHWIPWCILFKGFLFSILLHSLATFAISSFLILFLYNELIIWFSSNRPLSSTKPQFLNRQNANFLLVLSLSNCHWKTRCKMLISAPVSAIHPTDFSVSNPTTSDGKSAYVWNRI